MASDSVKRVSKRLYVTDLSVSYSCAANGQWNTNLKTLIDGRLAAGERCLGVVGFSTASIFVYVVSARYENTNYSLQLKNTTNAAQNENVIVYFLVESA